jgi:hypothetical protein
VNNGRYFTINRPRQYGKTTAIYLLAKELRKKDYLVLKMSFEGLGSKVFANETLFINSFIREIKRNLRLREKQDLLEFIEENNNLDNVNDLGYFITDFIRKADQKVILMIDEVDKSSNNQLFLDFLGVLRNKYLLAKEGEDYTFHSVILAGVHDVKNLKLKLRPAEERKYNSPWNIAVDFEVDMDFNVKEISTMLDDSIPLTTGEYDEWGNPNEKEYYDYIKTYSPYDNIEAKAYPNLLVTTGLYDSQVQYWEPAKWVAKLRELKTDDNKLFFETNMDAGHGGASGRFEALKELAKDYVFIFDLEQIKG